MKLTIIVPVYNAEDYLEKCIQSLLSQNINNYEIILIDDCSLDKSCEILRYYELKYPEIIKCYYLKNNMKQGYVRNFGVSLAEGEYILFVDSDDYISQDLGEIIYERINIESYDLICFDWYNIQGGKKYLRS